MRTTVTLDDDVLALIRRRMDQDQVSFKVALNEAIRDSAGQRPAPQTFTTATFDMGTPSVAIDRALQLAAELEDEELLRRLRRRA